MILYINADVSVGNSEKLEVKDRVSEMEPDITDMAETQQGC